MTKAAYVVAEAKKTDSATLTHTCHWPGCERKVAPSMFACPPHWKMLPRYLQARIWAAYRPGQEKDKRPSSAYINAARDAELFAIAANDAAQPQRSLL